MRQVFETMGTVVALESTADASSLDAVAALFFAADRRFSLYRPDSELSAVAGGADLTSASDEVRELYAAALEWRSATGGAFTAHRPDGVIDLNGIVKAWAMRAAGELLGATSGGDRWCLNVGGDVLVAGDGWTVGLVDPFDRNQLLGSVTLVGRRLAAATSGSAERGDHIWRRSRGPAEFTQVTVLADDIITADVLATAIVSGGDATLAELTNRYDIDVLAVRPDGELLSTPGMRTQLCGQNPVARGF